MIFLEFLGALLLIAIILFGISQPLPESIPFPLDIIVSLFIAALIMITFRQPGDDPEQLRKLKLSIIIAFVAPFTIGIIFKYFLLVPMPFEGLVVSVLDAIWYADFWS